jgi:HSP20 family molecular chaperone IbpA
MVVKHLRRATLADGTTARESRRAVGASVPLGREPADPIVTLRTPLYSLEDDQESLLLIIELPGAGPNKIDLEVTDHDLVITATSDPIGAESLFYRYHGTLTLPEEIEPNDTKAEYEHGLLRVVLPKVRASTSKRRKVAISETRSAKK